MFGVKIKHKLYQTPTSSSSNGPPATIDKQREAGLMGNKTSVRLLCMVLMTFKYTENARAVKETWGKRCDKLLFISNLYDAELGAIKLNNIPEWKSYLWKKTRAGFKYLYDHYLNDYDWFYKADVDTYVIVENLRYVLTPYDPEFPLALGERALKNGDIRTSYLSGGGGYVLSRGALRIYGKVGYHNKKLCKPTKIGSEDRFMGICMTRCGIMLGDSRDEFGRHRFYQHEPEDYIYGKWQHWYPKTMVYPYGKGIDSFAETSIAFHGLKMPSKLYALEFFVYGLQVFGLDRNFHGPAVAPLPPDTSSIPKKVLMRYGHLRRSPSKP